MKPINGSIAARMSTIEKQDQCYWSDGRYGEIEGRLRKAEGERQSRRGRLSTNLEPHKPTTRSKTIIWIFPE